VLADRLSVAGSVTWKIADLPGNYLGLFSGNSILIDRNGGDWDWFIDLSPADDLEFTTPGNQGEQNRMDLLTVVMHELGHLIGLDHDDEGLMIEALAAGVRRTALDGDYSVLADRFFEQIE